jgi:hypothetical protein
MNDLDLEIQMAFQATSLVLVFVMVLFDLRYRQIQSDLQEFIPAGEEAKRDLMGKLRRSLLVNCGPLLLVNGGASYLFLPLFVRILGESRFEPWNFDLSRTSFVFIALLVFGFFLWSAYLAVQLVRRIGQIKLGVH